MQELRPSITLLAVVAASCATGDNVRVEGAGSVPSSRTAGDEHGDEHIPANQGAHPHPHPHPHSHGPDHFADPAAYVGEWNNPERDAWQKPSEIVSALGLQPGQTVVDLGAGTGYLLPDLSAAVGTTGTVVALDVEPAMVEFLRQAAGTHGWGNVRPHLASPSDPQLPPAGADAVVTLNVWHHIDDRRAYAARLLAALKPGGVFVVVDFLKEQTEGFGPPLRMRLRAEEVVSDLRGGGFEAELIEESLPRHYIVRARRP